HAHHPPTRDSRAGRHSARTSNDRETGIVSLDDPIDDHHARKTEISAESGRYDDFGIATHVDAPRRTGGADLDDVLSAVDLGAIGRHQATVHPEAVPLGANYGPHGARRRTHRRRIAHRLDARRWRE